MMQTRRASSRSHSILLWICMVCLLIIKAWCIDSLKQGESLNSTSQLDSPNGLFTLRFYSRQETNSTYIAVLFNGSEVAPVWIGNRGDPIPNDISTLLLTLGTRGELVITTGEGGNRIELYAGGTQRLGNITATLLDSGNFVVGSSDGDLLLWQSFDHPTDTLLSGMRLGLNRKIYSWQTPSDPAAGDFTLEWDQSSGELLIRRRGVVYWRSGHLKDYYNPYLGNVKDLENFRFRPDPINFNYNLTIEHEGEGDYFVYRVISVAGMTPDSRKVSSGWRLDWTGDVSTIGDRGIIMAQASVCYGNNKDGSNSSGAGCQPPCRMNGHQSFDLRSGLFRHANTSSVTPTLDNNSSLSSSDCREACWSNCECAGYSNTLGRDNRCSYWIGKDLVWYQDNEGLFDGIYVLQSPLQSPGEEAQVTGKKKNIGIIAGVVVSAAVLLMLGLAYFIIRKIKRKREGELRQLLTLEGYTGSYGLENKGANGHHLKAFTYASILSATNNFSSNNKLGQGGFGPVYKGKTTDCQDIAVKLLSRQSGQGLIEFRNELILISELQHVNLVKLIGFCIHKDDKMIIYDYMPNKSLDCFLFNPSKREQLDWKTRFNIIEGTAQGLLYLHKHSRLRIIHRDMKPNNILLDENMTPKISDFGLARIFKEDASEVNTERRVGTYGYMAPEYAMQGIFSVKTDVYSFGVLVLEIVSGRRNSSFHDIEGPLSIVQYAWELWRKDRALELMDPMLSNSCIRDQLQKCIQIGLLCVENHAVDRPTIEDALLMLKNETVTLPMPTNPAFITRKNSMVQQEENTPEKLSSDELIKLPANQFIKKKLTANQVTLSEVQGR